VAPVILNVENGPSRQGRITVDEQILRQVAGSSLGLAVSLVTLAAEDVEELSDGTTISRQLIAEEEDPRYLGQALSFVCTLLVRHMTPEEVRTEADAVIERAADWD
jgi:hypothetical protein